MSDAADTNQVKFPLPSQGEDFTPTSGTLVTSALTGPWFIERQTLQMEYVRVPVESSQNNSCATTLSGAATTHGNMLKSVLLVNFKATYDTTISYQAYAVSSSQQPQTFTLLPASGDPNGVTYGSINASTLGPMGNIATDKPYINRVPYTSATNQQLISRVSEGATFAVIDNNSMHFPNGAASALDSSDFQYDLGFWKDRASQKNRTSVTLGAGSRKLGDKSFDSIYSIPGVYATSKEFQARIQPMIDGIGTLVTNEYAYAYPLTNLDSTGRAKRDEGFVEYDVNRHA